MLWTDNWICSCYDGSDSAVVCLDQRLAAAGYTCTENIWLDSTLSLAGKVDSHTLTAMPWGKLGDVRLLLSGEAVKALAGEGVELVKVGLFNLGDAGPGASCSGLTIGSAHAKMAAILQRSV